MATASVLLYLNEYKGKKYIFLPFDVVMAVPVQLLLSHMYVNEG